MRFTDLPTDADALVRTARVIDLGMRGTLDRALRTDRAVRLRRGVYADSERRDLQSPAERYRDLALAAGSQRVNPVYAGFTAAVLHGLPIVGRIPEEIFLLASGPRGRRRNGVTEITRRGDESIVHVRGRLATALPETIVEVARRVPLRTSLVMADAALRADRFGRRSARCTRAELEAAFTGRLPFPGSRAVAAMLVRASSAADTPLETISRLQLEQLGYPAPTLQLAVRLPDREATVYLDFAWPELGIWGEADGVGKYLGSATTDPARAAETVIEEKRREDAVRSVTGWRCVRWGWRDAWSADRFRRLLDAAGLPRS